MYLHIKCKEKIISFQNIFRFLHNSLPNPAIMQPRFYIALLLFQWSIIASCHRHKQLFEEVSSKHSGIIFNNRIVETDSLNPIDVTNMYNGGGVGVGDFNNDGLQDIFLAGNMVSSRLYLNKGELKFEDITDVAGTNTNGRWCKGVSIVDINNDGWMDIYVCVTMNNDPAKGKNLLYINQGLNKDKVPVFKEESAAYGLNDPAFSTMANFFDYDNDGDLDVYIAVNDIPQGVNPSVFRPKITDGSFPSTGRLYRNDWDSSLHHPKFTDVTKQAGVTIEGYGHGVSVADINQDGWKDIFVTNDFIANDLLYINNHDGTFTEKSASYFKHTSANGMGQDIIDINNDGLSDVVELDMNPEDNYRKKTMLGSSSYRTYQLNDFFHYQHQYVRNTLQLNMGPRVNGNDSIGDPVFGDVGLFAGVAETDWSWTPLVADFNNDGFRDLIVTNGFPKDITDRDFLAYRREATPATSQKRTLAQIPEVKLHNYAFQNNGNCGFTDVSAEWGFTKPGFSNGAAYADLDNDGDLDMIVNNVNDEASVYENTSMDQASGGQHYLSVQLTGDAANINGIGTWVELRYHGKLQVYEQTPYRGYLSTIQLNPHFGLDTVSVIDSLIVKWPDGTMQVIMGVAANQTIKVNKKDAASRFEWGKSQQVGTSLFKDITAAAGINYRHSQEDHIDFDIQKILPHKFSEYGPALATGDLNGDGLDDMVLGGNSSSPAVALLQQPNGSFIRKEITHPAPAGVASFQDMGIALFDADGDGDLDLYIARGGYESAPNNSSYQDCFYINDGKGNFTLDSLAIPPGNFTSKSCVRVADFDKDGRPDLFIAGRVSPWNYPSPVSSFIYRNDSKNGHIKFTDVTNDVAKGLNNIGLVCDAVFSDFDNDGYPDLVLAGEWMPLTFFKNDKGSFKNVTGVSGTDSQVGWWNSIVAGDFDNDGDIDYVVGNLGQNSFLTASQQYPVSIYAKDFDNNKSYDAVLSLYLPASQQDQVKKEVPFPLRDDLIKQIVGMRSKFPTYKSYANATMDQVFSKEQLDGALILKANNFQSTFFRNEGNGKFSQAPLPYLAQLSTIDGMVADDFDGDGNLDVVMNTNDFSTDVNIGRYDALNGLLLKGDGKGNFIPQSILASGIFIPGNGKAMAKLRGASGKYLLAATQNKGPLKLYELERDCQNIPLHPDDVSAEISYRNGKKQKREFYSGSSLLSQSARFLSIDKNVDAVTIFDNKGRKRRFF